jgi:AraC-like DNA-binding protein
MSFILKNGFIRPYVGIGFDIKENKEYDISFYNRIKIDISGKGIKPVFVYLILRDSSTNLKGNILIFRHLCKYIEISPERKLFKLTISEFKIPDWWFDKYNLSPATINPPNWKKMFSLAVATGLTPTVNEEQSIRIYSIVFYRNNTLVVLSMIVIQLLIISSLMWLYYIRTRSKKPMRSVVINYHAITLDQKQKSENIYLDYINENFQNSDLSLHLVSEQTGINQRKIAESIYAQFNCNVKTYINKIRIQEALRLLKETELSISEIAYKVGFSSPSNFNRVFKHLTNKTPSDYIQH